MLKCPCSVTNRAGEPARNGYCLSGLQRQLTDCYSALGRKLDEDDHVLANIHVSKLNSNFVGREGGMAHFNAGISQEAKIPVNWAAGGVVRASWGEAPDVSGFVGRTEDLAELEQWIVRDGCRLVALLGILGVLAVHY